MWGSRPSHFMIIPNSKRHPSNTKTDQLPISEVITGLPRPYHHNHLPWRKKKGEKKREKKKEEMTSTRVELANFDFIV